MWVVREMQTIKLVSSIQPSLRCITRSTFIPCTQRRYNSAESSPQPISLSWNEYLRMRRQRRIFGIASSVPTSLLGFASGLLYFGSQEVDPTQVIFGMDPFMVYGIATVGCAAAGWLVGPPVGTGVWHLWNRKKMPQFLRVRREKGA